MDTSEVVDALWARRASLAVLADFDGTLSPIVADAGAAVPLPGAVARLGGLADLGIHVALVSGRPVDFLRRHAPDPRVQVVGQYGLEHEVDGTPQAIDPRAAAYADAVHAAAAEAAARFSHLDVEPKGDLAVTVHWRAVGGISNDELGAIDEIAERFGLWVHATRMARELRVPLAMDKGKAVARLLRELGCDAALFAGDDLGDVAAFGALEQALDEGRLSYALKVGVLSDEAPSELIERADVIVDGPVGFVALLDAFLLREE